MQAQPVFKTVVPQQPVIAGEAFQVQYILEGGEKNAIIQAPPFTGCRLISGPHVYTGSEGIKAVSNFVYTLEANRPGRVHIAGATIVSGNKTLKSNPVIVEVISAQDAIRMLNKKGELLSSEYFLRPGEDPYRKIRENLFVTVQVDKRSCRVGEPVLAIFKLYSRLESQSDIIKNPGFYGFTVYDMVGLSDKQVATEKLNGRVFDVHTIRKVQLYPLQPGRFSIDAMEVKNRVEFSRSAINRKTEQQIAEGMMGIDTDEPVAAGTDVFETTMSTAPVEVEVKPLPEKTKPAIFSGAVGRFNIRSDTPNVALAKNEEGFFDVTISGWGNFTQLDAPVIQWPAGVEGFEPTVKDELDKSRSPLQGSRVFRFPFVCAAPGTYTIPAVSFAYFDTDSNRYKTVSTAPVKVEAGKEVKKELIREKRKTSLAAQNEKATRTGGLIAIAAVLLILLYWIFGKKEKPAVAAPLVEKPVLTSVEELLKPVRESAADDDRSFYTALQSAIWTFASQRFDLSGSTTNKSGLAFAMTGAHVVLSLSQQILEILETCETGIFTQAILGENKELLLERTKEVLQEIDLSLQSRRNTSS